MKNPDKIKITGKWHLKCFGPDGKLRWEDKGKNLVVTAGLNHIADQLADQGESAMSYMAAGSSNTAPAAGQTALISQISSRKVFDSKAQVGGNTVEYVTTFDAGEATGTWEELGIFNAASGGVMFDRLLTGTKVKNSNETFEAKITLTISAS